jgi:AraC family transcriptional regulator
MHNPRIIQRPAFHVIGKKTWISGQDSALFGRFWEQCTAEGLFEIFSQVGGLKAGPQTGGSMLGISRVEQDPTNRAFYYMIGIENPQQITRDDLENYQVPATPWAVFECRGKLPEAIVQAEIYTFTQWLPASGYVHALAPEMEVYPPGDEDYREFWLPIAKGDTDERG